LELITRLCALHPDCGNEGGRGENMVRSWRKGRRKENNDKENKRRIKIRK
jgi:hypothetical protein